MFHPCFFICISMKDVHIFQAVQFSCLKLSMIWTRFNNPIAKAFIIQLIPALNECPGKAPIPSSYFTNTRRQAKRTRIFCKPFPDQLAKYISYIARCIKVSLFADFLAFFDVISFLRMIKGKLHILCIRNHFFRGGFNKFFDYFFHNNSLKKSFHY